MTALYDCASCDAPDSCRLFGHCRFKGMRVCDSPLFLGAWPNSTGRTVAVYRIRAWRTPNEDGAPAAIVFERAHKEIAAPVARKLTEIVESAVERPFAVAARGIRAMLDKDHTDREIARQGKRNADILRALANKDPGIMAQTEADRLRAQKASSTDPGRLERMAREYER